MHSRYPAVCRDRETAALVYGVWTESSHVIDQHLDGRGETYGAADSTQCWAFTGVHPTHHNTLRAFARGAHTLLWRPTAIGV